MRPHRVTLAVALAALLTPTMVGAPAVAAIGPIVIDDATYSWWTHPIAVVDSDAGQTWIGSISANGTVRARRVDGETGEVASVRLGTTTADDHNAAALVIVPDVEYVVAAWTDHGNDSYTRVTTIERNTMARGTVRRLTWSAVSTYTQLLRWRQRLVLLTRLGTAGSVWAYRVSEDLGATWGPEATLIDATGLGPVYITTKPFDPASYATAEGSSLFDLAFTGHPTKSTFRDTLYGVLDLETLTFRGSTGKVLGELAAPGGPTLPAGLLETAIAPSAGFRTRILDVGRLDVGHGSSPAIAFAVWDAGRWPGAPARYRIKVLSPGGWRTLPWSLPAGAVFGHAPAVHYVGGATFGPGRDGEQALHVAAEADGLWRAETYAICTCDGSLELSHVDRAPDPKIIARPYVPLGSTVGDELVLQHVNDYPSFTDYEADLFLP